MMNSTDAYFVSSTDVDSVVEEIVKREPLITLAKVEKVKELIASNLIGSIFASAILSIGCRRIARKDCPSG
jgi:hypothetical protein